MIPASGFNTVEFIIDKEGSTQDFVVRGTVRDANGAPLSGIHVRVLERDLRGGEFVGAVKSNLGYYEIPYAPKQFARAEFGGPDIQVQAFDSDTLDRLLGESVVFFNVGSETTIDLTLAAAMKGPSEYASNVATIEPLPPEGLSLSDLKENAEYQDFTFLAGDTGIPRDQISFLAKAAAFEEAPPKDATPATWIPAAAVYGWLRQGSIPARPFTGRQQTAVSSQ